MAEQYNVYGMWEKIRIFCNNHEKPVPMKILDNTEVIKTPFYACEDYISLESGSHSCPNRLNLDDYQGLVLKFLDMYAEDPLKDYTGYRYTYHRARQKVEVTVLHFGEKHIDLGIKNLTVLGK